MPGTDDAPRTLVVLVVGDREIPLGTIHRGERGDLGLIDDLLRLRSAVARRGWTIRLTHVDREMLELVELVGVRDCLGL